MASLFFCLIAVSLGHTLTLIAIFLHKFFLPSVALWRLYTRKNKVVVFSFV